MLTAKEAYGVAVEGAGAEVSGEVELFRMHAGRTHSVGGPLVPNGRAVSWDLRLWVPLEDGSVETEIEVAVRHNSIESLDVGTVWYGGKDCWQLLATASEWKLDSPEAVRMAMEQGGEGLIPVRAELTRITFTEVSVPESAEDHPMWRVDLAPLDTDEPGLQVIIDAKTGEVILTKKTEWF
jgi:hypothetical protein